MPKWIDYIADLFSGRLNNSAIELNTRLVQVQDQVALLQGKIDTMDANQTHVLNAAQTIESGVKELANFSVTLKVYIANLVAAAASTTPVQAPELDFSALDQAVADMAATSASLKSILPAAPVDVAPTGDENASGTPISPVVQDPTPVAVALGSVPTDSEGNPVGLSAGQTVVPNQPGTGGGGIVIDSPVQTPVADPTPDWLGLDDPSPAPTVDSGSGTGEATGSVSGNGTDIEGGPGTADAGSNNEPVTEPLPDNSGSNQGQEATAALGGGPIQESNSQGENVTAPSQVVSDQQLGSTTTFVDPGTIDPNSPGVVTPIQAETVSEVQNPDNAVPDFLGGDANNF